MYRIRPLLLGLLLFAECALGAPARAEEPWTGSKDWTPPALVAEDVARTREMIRGGRIDDAEALARSMLANAEREAGPESIEAMCALNLLGDALVRAGKGNTAEARETIDRAMRISVDRFGAEHPLTAWAMQIDAWVTEVQGDLPGARRILERALAIVERSVPPEHDDVVTIRNSLATLLGDMGLFDEAIVESRRVVEASEKSAGHDSATHATTLNNLAVLVEQLGRYDEALALQMEALAIREKILEPNHPDFAQSWTNIAINHLFAGRPKESLVYFRKTIDLAERTSGPEHPSVANALNNCANVVTELGDLLEARRMHERARSIRVAAFGPDHVDVSQSVFNMATLDRDLGDLDEAERGFQAAYETRNRILGSRHFRTCQCLVGLGHVLRESGRAEESLAKFEEGAAGFVESLGPFHPEVASAFASEGRALLDLGRVNEADSLFHRALAIRDSVFSGDHTALADSHEDLGDVALARGDAATALAKFERALAIRKTILGDAHPSVARDLRRRANALAALGRTREAFRVALDAETIGREHVRLVARGLSERQAMTYAAERASGLALAVELAAHDPSATDASEAWDAVIRGRALALDELAKRSRAVARTTNPDVAQFAFALADARRRFANLSLRGPDESEPETYRAVLEEARSEKERAEAMLAERSESFRVGSVDPSIGLADVTAALEPDEALVAFLQAERSDASEYVAFVWSPGADRPQLLALGDRPGIDGAVAAWHESLGATDSHRGITRTTGSDDEAAARVHGLEVSRRLWEPLAPWLAGARVVFLVPDGAVHLVSFDALPVGRDRYLAEEAPLLHYLSAERDLLRARRPRAAGTLLAIGGPDFDASPAASSSGPPLEIASLRGERVDCDAVGQLHFLPLRGARDEVEDVARSFGKGAGDAVETWVGADATESRVKRDVAGHRVLHFATHGFVLADACASPLVGAGLALAGANRRGEATGADEDGILTAEEIASLDLHGVEWAVLSACDTGLGQIRVGEGILGLRRAFEVAGAGTLITSLWRVDDASTAAWMNRLYAARFEEHRTTPEAVRSANLDRLRARRAAGQSTHPRSWGGFVAAGDWN
jgi:CHAT domain-containing protein/tetratricopeptide (TPR) repeat protein